MINVEEIGASSRKRVLNVIVISAFVFLLLRLYQLQLLFHAQFGEEIRVEISVRTVVKEPVRGYFLTATGSWSSM